MWNPSPTVRESESLSSVSRLIDGFTDAGAVRFSSNGQWIAFRAKQTDGHVGVYLAQLRQTGSAPVGVRHPILITSPDQEGGAAAFAPNGISLYLTSGSGLPHAMRIYRADGWQGAVAALAPGDGINLARHPITNDSAFSGQVDVSPDNRTIVFTSNRDGNPELYAMPADGGEAKQLTHADGFDGWGRFSPDGKYLLFQRSIKGQMQIMLADCVMDQQNRLVGLRRTRQLTRNGGDWPCWHPDGRHILYSATADNGDIELFVIRSDGSRQTRITFSPGPDILPAVSPDGTGLIWSSGRGKALGAPMQLYIARLTLPEGS